MHCAFHIKDRELSIENFMPDINLNAVQDILAALGGVSLSQITIMDAQELSGQYAPSFSPGAPALILNIHLSESLSNIQLPLRALFPAEHPVELVRRGMGGELRVVQLELNALAAQPLDQTEAALFVPALRASYAFEPFQNIIARLRAPGGCPWDQKQTHQSLRSDLMEEAYEVLAALDANDPQAMREELGDLLLHVVMQAQIAAENGEFNMGDVLNGIHTKIVRRHPHVFGDYEVDGEQDILASWEETKARERQENGQSEAGLLDSLNLALPALVQAQQFQSRAARVKFDWPNISGVLAKVFEEIEELGQAKTAEEVHAETGDLLFAVVNLARWRHVDAESALRQANERFRQRFKYIEQAARSQGRQVSDLSLDEMDQLWEAAKRV